MKFSYNWLQSYIDSPLPPLEELVQVITLKLAEVDGVEEVSSDYLLDVSILPDRMCYALSHRGLAYEIAAITGLPYRDKTLELAKYKETLSVPDCEVLVEDVLFFSLVSVNNLRQEETPPWMKKALTTIGQKSISPIVDAVNYILFDIGQPLHVFDADKVVGSVRVRYAKPEETFTTLDNKEITLHSNSIVVADDEGVLSLAGIKGGARAGVTKETKNILIESASFLSTYVRTMSQAVGVQTDSSKRFENNVTSALAPVGKRLAIQLIKDIAGSSATEVGFTYEYGSSNAVLNPITITKSMVENKIGIPVSENDLEAIFTSLRFAFEKNKDEYYVTPPPFRKDILSWVDITEEVMRIKGVNDLPIDDVDLSDCNDSVSDLYSLTIFLKEKLQELGYFEHYGRVFGEKGDCNVLKSYASDKTFVRNSLVDGLTPLVKQNLNHVLFDHEPVRMFEIGTTFSKDSEDIQVAIAVGYKTKKLLSKANDIERALETFIEFFGLPFSKERLLENLKAKIQTDDTVSFIQFSLADLRTSINTLPRREHDVRTFAEVPTFKPYSPYPRIIRDIAIFTPPEVEPQKAIEVIKGSARELCVEGPVLFDVYQKKNENGDIEKVSLAFRLVFQSFTETLTDAEVELQMQAVYEAIRNENWEIR